MDGVVVDFDGYCEKCHLTPDEVKIIPGAYLAMEAFPGALDAVRNLFESYDVFFASKPPTGIPYAYSDKAAWVFKNIPEMSRRLILTSNKGLLGDHDDVLVDDRPDKANCVEFPGHLIVVEGKPDWKRLTEQIKWAAQAYTR